MGHIVTALKRSVSLLVLASQRPRQAAGSLSAKAPFENSKLGGPVVIEQPLKSLGTIKDTVCFARHGRISQTMTRSLP